MSHERDAATLRTTEVAEPLGDEESLVLVERLQRLVRFSIPHNAPVIVRAQETPSLLQGEGHTVWSFTPTAGDAALHNEYAAIDQLEALRAKGGAFLLIAHSAWDWFAAHPQFKHYVEQRYRVILREEDTGIVFALQPPPDAEWRAHGAPDGLPLPPPELVALVTGMSQVQPFYWSGLLGARCIRGLLNKNGFDMNRFDAILDFGCGCGRVMRHWKTLNGPRLFGTDYNPYLISWCQRALPFAQFSTNALSPPLVYADAQFDLIYTISIFTHLEEALQLTWMAELSRLLRPGGVLLVTVHGATHIHSLPLAQQQQFTAGELVVYSPELSGSNHCATYHPERYVRDILARDFRVIDFIPSGAKDANQDVFLLQKPMTGRQ